MKIAILGTGVVGRTHAARLSELGHEVILGTQDVERTRTVTEKDAMGNLPFGELYFGFGLHRRGDTKAKCSKSEKKHSRHNTCGAYLKHSDKSQ